MSFVPDWPTIIQFAIATFIIAITPGPDMTLFVGRALSEGRAAGFACMFGAMSGIVVHTLLVALGLSALIVASPEAFLVLKAAGAGYLVWLAYQAIRHGSAFSPEAAKGPKRSLFQNWATGLGINLLNPKIILFFMTFLPQFVSASDPHAGPKLMFLGLYFIVLAIPICFALIFAAERFTGAIRRSPRLMRAIDWLFATLMGAFAVRLLFVRAD